MAMNPMIHQPNFNTSDNINFVEHVLGFRRAARRTSQPYRSADAITYEILTNIRKHLANAFSMISIVLPLFPPPFIVY